MVTVLRSTGTVAASAEGAGDGSRGTAVAPAAGKVAFAEQEGMA